MAVASLQLMRPLLLHEQPVGKVTMSMYRWKDDRIM